MVKSDVCPPEGRTESRLNPRQTRERPATGKPREPDNPAMPESWESLFVRAAAFDVETEAVTDALAEVRDGE